MTIVSELFDDAKFVLQYRKNAMKVFKALDAQAPRAGDLAPDFSLFDIFSVYATRSPDRYPEPEPPLRLIPYVITLL